MKFLFFLFTMTASAATLVEVVRLSLAQNDYPRAQEIIRAYRAARGVTPEAVEALSWMARGELAKKNVVQADKDAQETYRLALEQMKTYPLSRSSNLQIALGGAIEVEANVLVTRGQRAEAITYLSEQLKTYYATPLRPRIQKNINLLSLEGKRAPALEHQTIPAGKPALLFFWAHWCSDCKYEIPILARIKAEFAPKGLAFIPLTEKFGYVAGGEDAPPEVEVRYIEQVRQQFYSGLIDAPALINEENFNRYGASTTPTFVLIDRNGLVKMYHPGGITYEELRPRVEALFR